MASEQVTQQLKSESFMVWMTGPHLENPCLLQCSIILPSLSVSLCSVG